MGLALDATFARMPEGRKPGQFRHALDSSLPVLSKQQVLASILDGDCILCQRPRHGITQCPLFRQARGSAHAACIAYKQVFFDTLCGPK